jgi:uncharacterized protein
MLGALAAALAVPSPAAAWTPEAARYGVSAPREQTMTMSDGVRLRADVYYPTDPKTGQVAAGSFPVILAQTPYGKRSSVTKSGSGSSDLGGDGYFPYLVTRGYVNAIADVRGTGSSDGDFELFGQREIEDGVDLVHWAAGLPHTDGGVGTSGESYVGLNQIFTAAEIGPNSPLKAIFPVTAGNDLYRDLAFAGGIPNAEFAAVWSALRASMIGAVPDDPTQDPLALAAHPIQRAGTYAGLDANLYTEIEQGGPRAFDTPFWQQRSPRQYLAKVVANGIPAFLLSGWFDVYQRGVVLDYAQLQNAWALAHPRATGIGHSARRRRRSRPPPPGAPPGSMFGPMAPGQRPTPRYQAAIGPWFHNPSGVGERYQTLQLEWFDTWLKGETTGLAATSTPLHVFELGPNRWIEQARYPFPSAQVKSFYFGANGSLAGGPAGAAAGTDRLAWTGQTSPCNRNVDQWDTSFVSLVGAFAGLPAEPGCANDDRTTQAGALTYTTPPFVRAATIAGAATASVYASSTSPDAELAATLEDVGPDGSSYPLGGGVQLASLRRLDSARSWYWGGRLLVPYHPSTRASSTALPAGKLERIDVEIYPTFARIGAGHRLRLTLASGMTAIEPTPVQAANLAGGVYAIAHDRAHPSVVNVPLASPAALPTSPVGYGPCNAGCRP